MEMCLRLLVRTDYTNSQLISICHNHEMSNQPHGIRHLTKQTQNVNCLKNEETIVEFYSKADDNVTITINHIKYYKSIEIISRALASFAW